MIENYESLPNNQKEITSNMQHVFCGLHALHKLVIYSERPSWNGKKLWKRKVVSIGDLKPQIAGYILLIISF